MSALLKYAKRQRYLPRGWPNPVLEVEAQREDNARVRFLSEDERKRLLSACKASKWPKLYLLVLMALRQAPAAGNCSI